MEAEIQLVSDGDGLAIIGDSQTVERFVSANGLETRSLDLPRLGSVLSGGGAAAQAGSEIAANSGRWAKLTKESAALAKEHGLRSSSSSGLSTGVVKGQKGQIKAFVEFTKGPVAALTNPAVLAGAAGIMAQLAMQQTMDEILDYLAVIDKKLDAVTRTQTNQVLARVDGADLAIREAMTLRDSVGRVSDITWSKVQATSSTILETQAFALRQIQDLAAKLERITKVGDLAKATKDAESEVHQWLAALARCFQLQDAIAILEIDRVLAASPVDLDRHWLGLKAARDDRRDLIMGSTARLLERMDAVGGTANSKVLLNPTKAPALVASSNHVAGAVLDFYGLLGISQQREALAPRHWKSAASDTKNQVIERSAERIDAVRRASADTLGKARSATGQAPARLSARARGWRGTGTSSSDPD